MARHRGTAQRRSHSETSGLLQSTDGLAQSQGPTLLASQSCAESSWWLLEMLGLVLLFFVLGGASLPPDVNETHYLTKAKHFWNPSFCAGDHFLASPDAHTLFFATVGWLTKHCSLPTTAWLGRILGWIVLASGWLALSRALLPQRGMSLLSAGAWLGMMRWGQMSGEWIVGGCEAKVFAYGWVFWGLRSIVLGHWGWGGCWLGIATAWHVLVGGWTWILALAGLAIAPPSRTEWRRWPAWIVGWLLGGVVAWGGVGPALQLQAGVEPATITRADYLYVWERLAHHLLVREFPLFRLTRHALLVGGLVLITVLGRRLWRESAGWRRLLAIVFGAFGLVLMGAALDGFYGHTRWGTALLRYYWFRPSDGLVPLGIALAGMRLLQVAQIRFPRLVACGALVGFVLWGLVAWEVWQSVYSVAISPGDVQGNVNSESRLRDWQAVCAWVKDNTPADSVCLTPTGHQTFKWYAQRAEYANTKDVPQGAEAIVEWYNRLERVHDCYRTNDFQRTVQRLEDLCREYRLQYAVQRVPLVHAWPTASVVYQNPSYVVMKLRDVDAAAPVKSVSREGFEGADLSDVKRLRAQAHSDVVEGAVLSGRLIRR